MHHDTTPDLVKPLAISALIILAVAGGGVAMALKVQAARPMPTVAAEPVGATITLPNGDVRQVAAPAAGAAQPEKVNAKRLQRRMEYANEIERRYRARELPMVAEVRGNGERILSFRWTLQPNSEQLRLMEHAESLYGELKDLGFSRVEMLSFQTKKVLWYKDL
jgi:hypothetical protein